MKALVTCLALWFTAFLACASGEKVCLIKINGAIGPATASYISRSIGEAQSQNAFYHETAIDRTKKKSLDG